MTVFEPLGVRTTPAVVYERLRHAILDGHLRPGSQLREAHIAEEFGISRSPLREALSRLEDDGLVDRVQFRGAFVASVSAETIEEIAGMRVRLEPYAVERALADVRGPRAGELDDRLARLVAAVDAGDDAAVVDAHLAFHRFFYEAADHALLLSSWNGWEAKLRLFLVDDHRAFPNPHEVGEVHTRLLEVIRTGSHGEIVDAVQHHIHRAPGTDAVGTDASARATR